MTPEDDAQEYLRRAFLLLLDRTHGDRAIVEGRRLLRSCETLDAMEAAEKHFVGGLVKSVIQRQPKELCETLETVVMLIRCAMMAEWNAAADILDTDTTKAAAELDAAKAVLAERYVRFSWLKAGNGSISA